MDTPTTFEFDNRLYTPANFHNQFMGAVTLRTALAHSLNVATIRLAEMVGYGTVVNVAQRAGLNGARPTPSVALGTYEATPLQVAGGYTVFANGGTYVRPTLLSMVRGPEGDILHSARAETRRALDPRVTYLMVGMLEEVMRSGTAAGVRARGFTAPAAGKTGTSRDGWFAGFTSNLLCVVWVGFDDNRDLGLEGAHSALPIWADFMKRATQMRQYSLVRPFTPPEGIVTARICAESGQIAGEQCPHPRPEEFIEGTQPVAVCRLHAGLFFEQAGADRIEPIEPIPPPQVEIPAVRIPR